MARIKTATEFGGVPGRVHPEPHELTAAEEMRLERAANPADPADTGEGALIREWELEGRL